MSDSDSDMIMDGDQVEFDIIPTFDDIDAEIDRAIIQTYAFHPLNKPIMWDYFFTGIKEMTRSRKQCMVLINIFQDSSPSA